MSWVHLPLQLTKMLSTKVLSPAMRFVDSCQRESVDIEEDWGQRRALRKSSAGGSPVRSPCLMLHRASSGVECRHDPPDSED